MKNSILVLLLTASMSWATDSIRFPESTVIPPPVIPPKKIESNKLNKGVIYYIDSDIPVLVMAAPQGLVKIQQAPTTPVNSFGIFVDSKSETEPEFRDFKGKNVFFITGISKGSVTLFIVPKGNDIKNEDTKTKTLEVFPDSEPVIPPTPKPDDPDPKPLPPSNPFYDGIKAAYVADAMDSVKIKTLQQVYDYAAVQAESAGTWSDLFLLMQVKAQELKVDGPGNVPKTKAYLANYLKSTLPSSGAGPVALTFADRVKAKEAFQKISDALKEVLK